MNELWMVSMFVLWLVVVIMAFLLMGSLRQIGLLQLRLGDDPGTLVTERGLDRGVEAPDVAGLDPDSGDLVPLSSLGPVARVVVFLSPTCLTCEQLAPHIEEVRRTRRNEFDWLVICQGSVEACRSFRASTHLSPRLLIDEAGELHRAFDVTVTPFAYLLDHQNRVVLRGVVNDWRHLESLLQQEGTLQPAAAGGH